MLDITSFTSKSFIKPELQMVYVIEKNGYKYAMATDSFRLVWVVVPDHLTAGWYTKDEWKSVVKNKSLDQAFIEMIEKKQ